MATVFLHHAPPDAPWAASLAEGLRAEGFAELFVARPDLGPSWMEALRAGRDACRVVVDLVTEAWLADSQYLEETRAAQRMGKATRALLLVDDEASLGEASRQRLAAVRAQTRPIDARPLLLETKTLALAQHPPTREALVAELRGLGGVSAVGPDPAAFPTDPRRSPYPGLAPFTDTDGDAAVFFGRNRELIEVLEALRAGRAARDGRALVIAGVAGAGKSSLLAAGVLPRLRREAPAWTVLHPLRPDPDPLLGLARSLAETLEELGVAEDATELREAMRSAWAEGPAGVRVRLNAELARLRSAAGRPESTVLLPIDPADALAFDDSESAAALRAYLNATASREGAWQLVLTTRTDHFDTLQTHPELAAVRLQRYDLRPLPKFRLDEVIAGPARRFDAPADPALVYELIEDAPARGGLPLVAFALRELWPAAADRGALECSDYRARGQLLGLVDEAAERALRGGDDGVDAGRDAMGARTFVPGLIDVDENGEVVAHRGSWSDFDGEARTLLGRFVEVGLVVRDLEAEAVEVASAAVFERWSRLASWLGPRRGRLQGLGAAPRAADDDAGSRRRGWRRVALGLAAVLVLASVGSGLTREFVASQWKYWTLERPFRVEHFDPFALSADAERALRPGDTFRECERRCPEMVVVPAGSYMMGDEREQDPVSLPRHKVAIARPFAVGRTEVSVSEFVACVQFGDCFDPIEHEISIDGNMIRFGADGTFDGRMPAISLLQLQVQGYLRWLSRMTGHRYRLLSSAEWEYVARAGSTKAYAWGDAYVPGRAHCMKGCGSPWEDDVYKGYEDYEGFFIGTAPVGSFPPNAFGVFDMHGNAWELVEDCWHETYHGAPDDGSPWLEDDGGNCKGTVIRGGGWFTSPEGIRASLRDWLPNTAGTDKIGFRVARDLDEGEGAVARASRWSR